jgi:polyhydroxybutyrate depolymerase
MGRVIHRAWVLGLVAALGAACGSSASDSSKAPSPSATGRYDAGVATPYDASLPPPPAWGDDASPATDAAPSTFACAGKTGTSGDRTLSLTSGGNARTSLLHVPSSYDPTRGEPLILNFHGFGSDATQETLLTSMSAAADARGFIVAYPQGIGQGWNAGDCCTMLQPSGIDDIQFVKDLLAMIANEYCIDPSRIYATGMSNGGFMSHRLACAMSDVFAAVAPVAGVLGIKPSTCTPSRSVPILDFHGTADQVVPYYGGMTNPDPVTQGFKSVQETMGFWRLRDACLDAPETTYMNGDATCVRWGGCSSAADITLCTIDGGGHTWPGGLPVPLGKTSTDIDATKTMIDFFFAHPMPSSP